MWAGKPRFHNFFAAVCICIFVSHNVRATYLCITPWLCVQTSYDKKSEYEGYWLDGLRHGTGVLSENGRRIEVEYKMGHRIDETYLEEQRLKESGARKHEQGIVAAATNSSHKFAYWFSCCGLRISVLVQEMYTSNLLLLQSSVRRLYWLRTITQMISITGIANVFVTCVASVISFRQHAHHNTNHQLLVNAMCVRLEFLSTCSVSRWLQLRPTCVLQVFDWQHAFGV